MVDAIKADPVWGKYWTDASRVSPEPQAPREPTTAHLRRKRMLR